MHRWMPLYVLNLLLLAAGAGCTTVKTTDTPRTGKEQLLISNSIDQALQNIDFSAFAGQVVFLQDKYAECVDKNYLVASIRHRAFSAGARVADTQEDADVVLEVRSGGVGTDSDELFVGVPGFNVPGPLPVSLPEIRLLRKSRQTGTAKIGLVAYDARTNEPLGDGGVTLARSDDNHWFVVGLGHYEHGSVPREIKRSLKAAEQKHEIPNRVAFEPAPRRPPGGQGIRLTSEIEDAGPTRPDGP